MLNAGIRPIRTEDDYRRALSEIDCLIDALDGTAERDRLEVISLLVADWEDSHHRIDPPDPISFLEFVLESRGLTRKALEPFIGSRARVAEITNRRRRLTMDTVRRLTTGLGLRADVLIQPYEVAPP